MWQIVPLHLGAGANLGPQLFLSQRGTPPVPEAFVPPSNDDSYPVKPAGGLWTSSELPEQPGESGWTVWCRQEEPAWCYPSRWRLWPEPEARLLVIESAADLVAALRAYRRLPDVVYAHARLDFVCLAADGFAGVHLTERGQVETRFSLPGLSGWDCESTIWLRWAFTAVEPVAGAA